MDALIRPYSPFSNAMKRFKEFFIFIVCPLGLTPLFGGEKPGSDAAEKRPFAAPTDLVATLADPINIDLTWKDNASNEAGYFVEYSPDCNDEFVIIEALPPNTTKYRHPNLIPHTRFVFRVRPIFGFASNEVEVTTGKEGPQQDLSPANEKKGASIPDAEKKSLKSVATAADAAPIELKATLIPPAGIAFEWKDRAGDADGTLLEIKNEDADFRPSAFLEAGSTSLVSYGFSTETKYRFRVRPFVYGAASNRAEQTTGEDPTNEAFSLKPTPAKSEPAK
jgi:hypothetical protein